MINLVKEYRKERNITQEQLASLAGISRKYLSMIEQLMWWYAYLKNYQ